VLYFFYVLVSNQLGLFPKLSGFFFLCINNKLIMNEDEISNRVISFAIDIHRALGPGLLERTYQECLFFKIAESGLLIEKEKPIPLIYEGVKLKCGYKVDLLVERKLVLEIKSIEAIGKIQLAQTLTYLKVGNYKLGLILNFNVVLMKNGIRRVINGSL
jgi:GxxExxY protein